MKIPEAGSPGAERALRVLEQVSAAGERGRTASELARSLGLPHNSTSRLLETLRGRGYVERAGADRRFFVTGRLLELARPRVGERSLAGEAFDALRRLRDRTGETAQLSVRSAQKCVILDQTASRHPVKVLGEIGFRVPLYSCAPGKAILAALPPDELDAFFRAVTLKRFTPATRATRKELTADLLRARRDGYAVDRAEGMEGIHCVGAAVLDGNGHAVAAVTVIAPAFRLRERLFPDAGRRCIEAAAEIRRRLFA